MNLTIKEIDTILNKEIGHAWYSEHSTKQMMPIKGGSRGLQEINPLLISWAVVSKGINVSGHSSWSQSVTETFADAFSLYIQGENLPVSTENWFNSNLKLR